MPRRNTKPSRPGRVTSVVVEADLRDDIDYDRFAWALLQYCRLKLEAAEQDAGAP